MKKIEHLGIAVGDLEAGNELFTKLLNRKPYKEEKVVSEGVTTSFFRVGDSQVELLEASDSMSPIARFIEKRGSGIHHLAFYTDNIYDEMERLKQEGFQLLSDAPKPGADGKLICFLHPKSTGGVLIELCQDA
ncbi:MAG: methylmalonyl-CoA epimerase [Luteibaculum sp.]